MSAPSKGQAVVKATVTQRPNGPPASGRRQQRHLQSSNKQTDVKTSLFAPWRPRLAAISSSMKAGPEKGFLGSPSNLFVPGRGILETIRGEGEVGGRVGGGWGVDRTGQCFCNSPASVIALSLAGIAWLWERTSSSSSSLSSFHYHRRYRHRRHRHH